MNFDDLAYEVIPANRIRRVTARRMRASVQEKPPVTLHRTIDVGPLLARLERMRSDGGDAAGRPTFTSVFCVVLAEALTSDPLMNACLIDDELRRYEEVHLAVAVATDDGLITPVLRPADLIDDTTVAAALARLGALARDGELRPEHLAPSTFTLTNLGGYGIEYFTPILNPPHVGILGTGRLLPAAGATTVTLLPLSLTIDHAALDGADGARFLQSLDAAAAKEPA